ncbi:disease resistance protein RPV1 [Jatropha curcas]|uniref:disease resistance protein RPV1 n=1 Tax=Jatropha curcas TaxID=180498 RepID=UPI0018952224|nr:disease resistance protein RPV1 [Jatropha curcas]
MASAAAAQEWRYDVFLSFRGGDTRNNFTSHLYNDLIRKGVITFKDDRELPKGESVPQQLPKAIQDSGILVVIFSQNYANSTWCLDELVKIFECKKAGRQTVLPIFYDVSPYDVQNQDGKFGEPFTEYEKLFKNHFQKVQEWRVALTEVANLSGWHLGDRDESKFIDEIVEAILRRLRRSSHSIAKDFVGMESRLEKMFDYLDLEQLNKVRIIGICGMGGIGKTTIAGVVYKDIRWQFEGSCLFVGNLKVVVSLEVMYDGIPVYDVYGGTDEIRNRFCRKRILVILDDVDQLEQLESLIGRRDENWFGIGSRVIITTRDEHLLKQHGVDETYWVEGLNYEDASELFCSKAIKNNFHEEEYRELCHEFVKYASGLPLALKVLGSSLFGKSVKEWNKTLDKLKKIPNEEILSKLQLSYDGLDRTSQEIFLDIACFFKGMETDYVLKVLESCGFFPDSAIGDLIDKSLITICCGSVWMHDLIQEMGREIVHKESRENPGLRRRIWLDKDVSHIQVKNMEANAKAIVLRSWKQEEQLSAKVFSRMKVLRLLILRDVPASQDIEYLSNELRYLEWYKCPCKSFPSNFQPGKLVELHMKCSNIEQLWKRSIKPVNELLKVIDLSYSRSLIKTPDFQGLPNLEKLNLEGCESLREVHQSIGVMKRLVFLNLKNCRNLVALPSSMCNLKSLQTLILSGCSKLIKLPDRWEDMTCLEKLDATGIGMEQLELAEQWDFHLPPWLMSWTWKNPHPMAIVFSSGLPALKELNASYCKLPERAIPNDLSVSFPFLERLDLSGNNFVSLPSSISNLSHLDSLEVSNCKRLQLLPDLPSTITSLHANNCTSLENLPNVSEKQNNPVNILMEFSNCSKLNDNYQGNIKAAFTWLKSHLLFLLASRLVLSMRHERCCPEKGYYLGEPHSLMFLDISMRFPGSEIPEWFNCQSSSNPLTLLLPPCEKWWNIAGFVICVVISGKAVYEGQRPCKFTLYEENKEVWNSYLSLKFPSNDVPLTSDHLYIFSVANPIPIKYPSYVRFESGHCYSSSGASPIPRDPYEEQGVTEVELTFDENVIKRCGIRIVRANELKELIQKRKPSEEDTELGLESEWVRKISSYLELIDSSSANPIPIDPCEEQSVTEDTEFGFRELRRSYLELIDTVIRKKTRSWEMKIPSCSHGNYVHTELVGSVGELNQLRDTPLTLSYWRLRFFFFFTILNYSGNYPFSVFY